MRIIIISYNLIVIFFAFFQGRNINYIVEMIQEAQTENQQPSIKPNEVQILDRRESRKQRYDYNSINNLYQFINC